MFILKKIGFYLFIAASIAVAIWGYFRLKESKEPAGSVLEHIPGNAMCVIETENCSELISQLTRQNLIWNSLLSNASITVAQNGISYLDSLVNSSPDIAEIISGNSIYWTFIKQEKNTEHLILFKLKEKNNEGVFVDFFKKSFAKDPSVSSFDAYYFINNKQKWLVSCKDGLVYLSSDLSLLQKCLELNKNESLANNLTYNDLLKINGEQKTQVYLNHNLTNLFSKNLFTQQSLFGVEVQLNEITLTGYSNTDSLSLFNCIKNQNSESSSGFEHLPNNPATLQGFNLSDADLFYKIIEQQHSKEVNEHNKIAWNTLNDSALYNIKKESLENIDNELLLATYVVNDVNSQIVSIKMKDLQKGEQLTKFISDSILNYSDLKVYKLNKIFSDLFSVTKSDFKNEYACLHENHLLFFSNKLVLNYFQQSLVNSQLLGKNVPFMNYATDNLLVECNYFYYENSELIMTHNLKSIINSNELLLAENATTQLSLTAKNFKNVVQVRVNASHAKTKTDSNNNSVISLWSFAADSIIETGAQVFTNHLTQENELCFQDHRKTLYLVNSTGNLIWKKKITEAIKSEIYTVDVFKNGKLQLLFNTDNYLHLIDRNGNYVQGYPIKLPAKVTSNVTVLDYEGNKDYRLFLACADKRIYNFTLYGVKTEGFVPVKTEAEVKLPISFVHIGASDYLITVDVSGKIYAFSRKGEGRIDFKNNTIANLTNMYVLAGNNLDNTKLIYLDDKNNLLNKITLSDKKESLKLGDELSGFKTSFNLVNDDSQSDILAYGNGALYAYDLFSSKLVEYFNELAVYDDAQFVETSENNWIIAFDKIGQKTDVITADGKLVKSLPNVTKKPLMCNLYKNGKMYALLVNGNKLSCQELQ
ncbi:MAG: hypothetical protein K9H41_08650 [Bacteroidia bacterium]|nr:hypothetical protein [Bacteroidia bacterium]